KGTRFHLVPRPGSRAKRMTVKTEAFFFFHHVNSFEDDDGCLLIDLIAYPNADIIEQLRLDNLRAEGGIDFGKLRRYSINLQTRSIERVWESRHILELSRIHYSAQNTQPYRFVYGVSAQEK